MQGLRYPLCLLLAAWGALPARGGEDASAPAILARAWVPNAVLPQGEVRLVRRDAEIVVQTVLNTRFPGRVEDRISANERKNWPGDSSATAYVQALAAAFEAYVKRKSAEAGGEAALVIDFVDGPAGARVDFSLASVVSGKQGLSIQPCAAWRSLTVAPEYLLKDQEYIVADAFKEQAAVGLERLRAERSRRGVTAP